MTAVAPELHVQRMAALKHANAVRTLRSDLKAQIRAGTIAPAVVLAAPASYVQSMYVSDFLIAIPKFGPVKTRRVLRALSISPTMTVGGISERQRAAIVRELEQRGQA